MRMTDGAAKALQQPDTLTRSIEMTPEMREKFKRVSCEIADIVRANTKDPLEGYMLLTFLTKSFEECYGIRGGIIMDKEDTETKD